MSELVVALDFKDAQSAIEMAEKVRGVAPWVKVGLELFCAEGPEIITRFKEMGFKVFVDLKFFDIPNTVKGAVRSATRAGADMLSLHALGGERMAVAAREGRAEGAGGEAGPLLMAITILTSMDEDDIPFPVPNGLGSAVLDLALASSQAGLDGVVCSGLEVEAIKEKCGKDFLALTPGIRPASVSDDQRRVVTPSQAVDRGSNFLVVGRPITGADDPAEAARRIVAEMNS
ncbi:orotidine-5'-phosphate decarboxylase [Maridesulfovibrio salexigens]|uniref:Orotidine 5'-phosphate decarboxylase n=1 Tax=Maridesulfovibrio salexigens (strain ATCC 14822 / DSM 2638 / NCIMB 8403 / VKM B-1763) TaxID=526222 RepID=PYRF_MARSD|nr:orotidine-5'-phosphate decarboxylase [Maridesulfovibrio salexigens]C6BZZ8.1 RecName: Full=Orotidine 5'-phosphate decarboxylase; AltName: Full=OMP decarboxylase; Short=OMPDCase; Short=OMPdecase [Maridesulfovibrio salexigens DSM 2638]ACS80869.1 orotidine 5'-phosphate decarboxylase [Maridesulfovibrio salexigens DSM 2638]